MLEDEKNKEKEKKRREERKLKEKKEQRHPVLDTYHQVGIVGGQTLPPSEHSGNIVYQPQYFNYPTPQPQGFSNPIPQPQGFNNLINQPDQNNLITIVDNEAQNLEVVNEEEISMDNNSNIDQQDLVSFQKVHPQHDYVDSQRSYYDLDTGKTYYHQ